MTDLLDELLAREIEDHTLDFDQIPGYIELHRALSGYIDQVVDALGTQFHERLYNALVEQSEKENLACFRHGFRMAGRLLLEAFSTRL